MSSTRAYKTVYRALRGKYPDSLDDYDMDMAIDQSYSNKKVSIVRLICYMDWIKNSRRAVQQGRNASMT